MPDTVIKCQVLLLLLLLKDCPAASAVLLLFLSQALASSAV
jgi:hypothetical protein